MIIEKTEAQINHETPAIGNVLLPAVFCRRISTGKYFVKIGEYEYEIYNHGYYAPDKCVWWEAVNLKTNEADFHEHTKSQLIKTMQRELS
jgi:hypothetical protein